MEIFFLNFDQNQLNVKLNFFRYSLPRIWDQTEETWLDPWA